MSSNISVDVQFASEAPGVPAAEDIESWITSAVSGRCDGVDIEVSVRVVDEAEGRQLNRDFRGKDDATNVLSFPSDSDVSPPGAPHPLGDIVICGPVVGREAVEQGKALADHWAHMLVHGALHLLGYDHEAERDAERMEALEKEILAAHGVADPYAA